MKNIAVIGAGTMGNGIAHVFAQNGFSVTLVDVSAEALQKAIGAITKNLDRQLAKNSITEDLKTATLNNIVTNTVLKDGVVNAELVVEAATENVELKYKIFRDLDQYTKADTILASNTSSISITKIAAETKRPSKVIGMHFMNSDSHVNRGITYSNMGNHKKAIEDFEAALKLNPNEVHLYTNIGYEKLQQGLYNETIEACTIALEKTPDDANALFYRGTAHVNLGNYAKSIEDLSRAVQLDAHNNNAWFNLSYAYFKTGNKKDALKAAMTAKELGYAVTEQYLNELKQANP